MDTPLDPGRRGFLSAAAFTAAAAVVGPATFASGRSRNIAASGDAATPPPQRPAKAQGKLRIAAIGCGGQGNGDLTNLRSHPDVSIVAVCDVDAGTLAAQAKKFACKAFRDYRALFKDFDSEFDAVLVSTPDHSHALPASRALKLGKHVYCQKPLTHNIQEARTLSSLFLKQNGKVATQMGTQRAANTGKRQALVVFADGIIGKATAVHAWSDRPGTRFGHGADRLLGADPVPPSLDWDLWLGGAPWRPYKKGQYAPFQWRSYRDFGTGAVGDMGCHILDSAFFALNLGRALSVKSSCENSTAEQCPTRQRCDMLFPGTEHTATDRLPLTWYDGQWPMDLPSMGIPKDDGAKIPANTCIIIGEKGTLVINEDGENRLYRDGKRAELKAPDMPKLNHYHQWVDACLGRSDCRTPFDFAANLTEALLLSAIASQFPEQELLWHGESMQFTSNAGANAFVGRKYTAGFEVLDV
jgi:predicted dehydrogenase